MATIFDADLISSAINQMIEYADVNNIDYCNRVTDFFDDIMTEMNPNPDADDDHDDDDSYLSIQ